MRNAGNLGGVPFIIKLDPSAGHTRDFFVFTDMLDPGRTIPFHIHVHAEELLLVEEGGVTATVGHKRALTGPRSMIYIPAGTWHSATNSSSRPVHMTSIYSRHGFDRYMRAIGTPPGHEMAHIGFQELTHLRTAGDAIYWDPSKGPYPPGVAHA